MAAAVQSSSTTAWASASTVVITKPSGLAVGDLMLGHVGVNNQTVTAPAGWTTVINDVFSGGGDTEREYVFRKIADSTDVAATNFTFTLSGSATCAGAMYRIDGFSAGTPIYTFDEAETLDSTTPVIANTVTPLVANSLLILLGLIRNTNSGATVGSYAIATSSPSFTEVYDMNSSGGGGASYGLFGAYGVRPQITATGDSTIAITGGAGGNDTIGAILVIPDSKDTTLTDTTTVTDLVKGDLGALIIETITLTDSVTNEQGKYFNQTKNSSTWLNQDKS